MGFVYTRSRKGRKYQQTKCPKPYSNKRNGLRENRLSRYLLFSIFFVFFLSFFFYNASFKRNLFKHFYCYFIRVTMICTLYKIFFFFLSMHSIFPSISGQKYGLDFGYLKQKKVNVG